ncbi:MAG TPA: hypothetical protein VL970_10755 [Candidatus Acidoferrales bacterium]|nr:hypothetical protein [Candidatus Acidoferrales bacterium]
MKTQDAPAARPISQKVKRTAPIGNRVRALQVHQVELEMQNQELRRLQETRGREHTAALNASNKATSYAVRWAAANQLI